MNKLHSDCTMKILMLGNSAVGKSCMLMRFVQKKFALNYYNTIGVDYVRWDTAGQDRFKNITSSYFRGADGIIIVFDITDRTSFQGVQKWLTEIQKYTDPSIKIILVGNKSDLNQRRQVETKEAKMQADKLNLPYLETSARSGSNVESAYIQLGALILNDQKKSKLLKKNNSIKHLTFPDSKNKNNGCC